MMHLEIQDTMSDTGQLEHFTISYVSRVGGRSYFVNITDLKVELKASRVCSLFCLNPSAEHHSHLQHDQAIKIRCCVK